jgi:hypothetical protein
MKQRKTVILWGRDDVLSHAMDSFLKAEETWKVERIFIDQGIDYLVDQVRRIKPEVVILHTANCAIDQCLLMQLIQDQPQLNIVTVSLENNLMQVYSKHNFVLREVSDLLSIIEDRYFLEHPVSEGGA